MWPCRSTCSFDFAPYRLSGTVYGALLNHRAALAALGEAVTSRRTRRRRRRRCCTSSRATRWSRPATRSVGLPAGASSRSAPRSASSSAAPPAGSAEAEALEHVAGYVIVADLQRAARLATTGRRSASRRATAPARSARASWPAPPSPTPTRSASRARSTAAGARDAAPPACFARRRGCSPTSASS